MANEEAPIIITPEQNAALDRIADRTNYRQARMELGILPLDRDIQVEAIQTVNQATVDASDDEKDETREIAIKRAQQLGGHPDDYDWRYQ